MSKRDYVVIADAIKAARRDGVESIYAAGCADAADQIALDVADHCAKHNARFDRNRFLIACGATPDIPKGVVA